jgi:copper chaperone CopZ
MKLTKTALSALALSLLAMPALAEETMDHSKMDHSAHAEMEMPADTGADPAMSAQTVTAKVNGLVCDFCAQAVRKVFKKQEAVESVKVDLDNGEIVLGLKAGADMDDETIGKLIRKSGYSLVSIDRGDGA